MIYSFYLELFDISPLVFLSCMKKEDKATQTTITLKDSIIVVLSDFNN